MRKRSRCNQVKSDRRIQDDEKIWSLNRHRPEKEETGGGSRSWVGRHTTKEKHDHGHGTLKLHFTSYLPTTSLLFISLLIDFQVRLLC
jgi:hypothetical protein